MDFALTDNQESIRDAVATLCRDFDDAYWLNKDREGGFPFEFHKAMADAGWLGVCIPEEYGGSGLGITEAAIIMRTISESGAGMSGASSIHMNIFGLNPVVVFGNDEQRKRMLPPMAEGKQKSCFAVTEPNTGLNTTQLKLRAERKGDRYVVNGQKVWISTAQVADKMLLLARTTPLEEIKNPTNGLSLFYTDFDRKRVHTREIEKMGRKAVDFERAVLREFRDPGGRPHRRGRPRLRIHPARHEPGAHPDRRRSGRPRHGRAEARHRVCEDPHRLQPPDRQEPGDPASAGKELDGARGRLADDHVGRPGSTTTTCRAAPPPTRRNTLRPRPASTPASRR